MPFTVRWLEQARESFDELQSCAEESLQARQQSGKAKSSRDEGLFKQVYKCIALLAQNPRHPGLQTHVFKGIENPFRKGANVFEAYVQNRTPGAYRVFWCYGPERDEITLLAITPHP